MSARQWCGVDDCEERAKRGQEYCHAHSRNAEDCERERDDDDGVEYADPGDRLRGWE